MATLVDIRPSILDLPQDEVLAIHMEVRISRRTPKKAQTKAKAKRITERRSIVNVLDKLSPEEMDLILAKFEKEA